jgi:hypothetical protein
MGTWGVLPELHAECRTIAQEEKKEERVCKYIVYMIRPLSLILLPCVDAPISSSGRNPCCPSLAL